ncbi:MAG: Ni/Fe hydrogenase subunit alpha [Caldimicrobium sp.]|nr:Ni/Fe hydrogenase subunit alpha [Caldimicrobium sp.]MCX7613149.1 Ni/Fe hydrogenase subunit alpha [Caldimicrobium sp.]MDW8183244.1 Ni/Fe hydrogenase subunit alpha [Caldimicrobium sp.]
MTNKIDFLTRVSGLANLEIIAEDNLLKEVRFSVRETPRLIEKLLLGRSYKVIPEITARICGICPVAYQLTALQAIEDAFGIKPTKEDLSLRKLIYLAEWIYSHTLHLFFVHLPDYYKVNSFLELFQIERELLEKAFFLRETACRIIEKLGGRAIHPLSLIPGGFSSYPDSLSPLIDPLRNSLKIAEELFTKLCSMTFPEFSLSEVQFVSLLDEDDYPILDGIIYDGKRKIDKRSFRDYFLEVERPYSTANHSLTKEGKPYVVGPMARFEHAFEKLSPRAKELATKHGIIPPVDNPFLSPLIRMLEIVHSVELALEIAKGYIKPKKVPQELKPSEGEGIGITEAPRGILWHHYKFDSQGLITHVNIVTPTSQNLASIELALFKSLSKEKGLEEASIRNRAETMIRNFDPCLPCATHFLEISIKKLD